MLKDVIQRPFVAQTINKNLLFIKRITSTLDALSIMPHARWREAYWEVEHILREAIDYRFEASNIRGSAERCADTGFSCQRYSNATASNEFW